MSTIISSTTNLGSTAYTKLYVASDLHWWSTWSKAHETKAKLGGALTTLGMLIISTSA